MVVLERITSIFLIYNHVKVCSALHLEQQINLLQKKITSHPLENLEHPDKKLNSLGIILIP